MENNKINFIELQATDLKEIKKFYGNAFGWTFTDYGDTYCDFHGAGISGGFTKTNKVTTGGTLVVLYHKDLSIAIENVKKNGGKIAVDIFSFPGGRRFEFIDPNGNKLAIWSDK
ncbi:VOC family protein [Flavobacterium litorale]|uniref:VOC family protein n=1 Tax=Flavobacterium litorale TaxID=2856519 RepID=A0ABX8VBI1_9FLAO|nr:VOC family protein [Flavobacterium litorale]QYJ68391.1 VOC family protein [Flavobacterium litorale]